MSEWAALPDELRDLVMLALDVAAADTVGALFLAVTCRTERRRYTRLVPATERRTLRPLLIQLAANEGTLECGADGGYVVPGERGHAYYRERRERAVRRVKRASGRWARAQHARDRVKALRAAAKQDADW